MELLVRICHQREHGTRWWVMAWVSTQLFDIRCLGFNRHPCWCSVFSSLSLLLDYFSPERREVKQRKQLFQWLQYLLSTLPLVNTSSYFTEFLCQLTLSQLMLKFRGQEGMRCVGEKNEQHLATKPAGILPQEYSNPKLFHGGRKPTRRIKNVF